jgi:hypothetical protein
MRSPEDINAELEELRAQEEQLRQELREATAIGWIAVSSLLTGERVRMEPIHQEDSKRGVHGIHLVQTNREGKVYVSKVPSPNKPSEWEELEESAPVTVVNERDGIQDFYLVARLPSKERAQRWFLSLQSSFLILQESGQSS